ncbi:Reverse transcriptase [Theobroma cacao]|nr:Reverse transcriptase [Theobroma cacao]
MDVKSAFLNGLIQEEVFVEQPPGFEDFEKSDHVFKLHKALYGLKQAPRAWYERLSKFLVEKGYDRGSIDTTLFIKRYLNDLIIVQIYVDDIIFGETNEALCKNFAKKMQGEFEMSMMGKLKYFLGLQIKQSEEGIFINQERYTYDMLKKFDMLKLKSISTPMSPSTKLDLDEKGKDVDQKLYRVGYSNADFASSRTDRKGTSETNQFLGRMLVSWSSKKQNSVALSTVEAEYVSLEIQTNLFEYFDELKLKGYNTFKNKSYSPSLVKELYSGIALKEKELVYSDDYVEDGLNVYLNGKEFVVIVGDLGNLLEIEGEIGEFELPEKYDPSSLWEIITRRKEKYSSKSNLGLIINPQIRILHYFIAANIQGRSGNLSYISLQDLWLMEHAFNGMSLNLGRFMIEKMRSACRFDKVNLPYGNVITSLVQKK